MMYRNFAKRGSNKVKYIFQFARITAFCLAGEIVPITALVMAVTGMVAQKCAGGKEHKNG